MKAEQKITPEEEKSLKEALVLYYSGRYNKNECFSHVEGISTGTYYNRKEESPDAIARIEREARTLAEAERSAAEVAFQAEQLEQSIQLQRLATTGLLEAVSELVRIAKGNPRKLFDDEKQETKTIYTYPRDQIGAATILQQMARGGVLPEGYIPQDTRVDQHETKQMIPLLPVGSDFSEVRASTPDGRILQISVEAGHVVEEEIDAEDV